MRLYLITTQNYNSSGALNYVEFRTAMHLIWCMARLRGFEPPTHGLEVRSSIHLSYRRLIAKYTTSLCFRQGEFRSSNRWPSLKDHENSGLF